MKASYTSFAGIDVCKAFLDIWLLPSKKVHRVTNDAPGHRGLIEFLQSNKVGLVVLEATGGYEHAAVVAMVLAKLAVHVAQPQIIHAFIVSLKLRAQNDRIDACACARYAQDRGHELRVIEEIDKNQEKVAALVNRRDELVKMHTMEQNRVQQASDKATLSSIKRMLKSLESEIDRVEKEIDKTIKADPVLCAKSQKLRETPGIGPQTARVLVALLPELGTATPKALNALVGVAPYAADSGDKKGTRRIAGGRMLVRNGLYMAGLTAIYKNPVIAPYYQRLTEERGFCHKTAMMACIRRLLAHLDKEIRGLWDIPVAAQPSV
jgi:transposase